MTSAQVVETSVNVISNSPSQDYTNPDNRTLLYDFAKNWVKTLVPILCTKSCLFRGDRQVLVVFPQMPYFLQHFSKNWVKTLVHGTLHKKLLISRRSTSFGGFSPNAILFATFY